MREPRKIVGGELVRQPDETDDQWAAALEAHELSRRIGKLFVLKHAIDHAVAALCGVEEPKPAHLRDAADLAGAVMSTAAVSGRQPEVQSVIDELLERVLDVRREIARALGNAGETTYDDASLEVLEGMTPVRRRPEGHFVPEEEAEILRDPGPEVPLAEVVFDPTIMSGDPTIKGTRVLAATILAYLRAGHTEADIHEDFPTLPAGGIAAVLQWDAERRFELRAARADPESVLSILDSLPDTPPEPGDEMPDAEAQQQVSTRYYSISFPLLPGDEGMPPHDVEFKYAMLEVLARMRGGITPVELSDLGLRDAWDVLSGWVDEQRRRR